MAMMISGGRVLEDCRDETQKQGEENDSGFLCDVVPAIDC
jgi:hypothetical protein